MVIGGIESQKHSLSTTTMKRLLLGICWITKDLKIKKKTNNGDIISISEPLVLVRSLSDFYVFTIWNRSTTLMKVPLQPHTDSSESPA